MFRFFSPYYRYICSFLLVAAIVLALPQVVAAKPQQQIKEVRGPVLQGELPYQFTAHYFGIEVNQRDGLIALTLAYEPQNNRNLRGLVNFMVLDEDGMRRFQAGTNPRDLDLAAGSPLEFDDVGNKMSGAFRAVGRGEYTVIVYNNAQLPIRYTLIAEGATLVDNANQSIDPDAPVVEDEEIVEVVAETPPSPLGAAIDNQLSGILDTTIGRHYLEVQPDIRDGNLIFDFRYDPLDQPALHGNVNFWVLDQKGLNAIIRGDKPRDVNLATGFPVPFNPFPNELQASFNASGKNTYTTVIYNQTAIPATYVLTVDGGQLVDRYGQTLEAKRNQAEETTSVATTTTEPFTTESVEESSILLVANRGNVKTDTETVSEGNGTDSGILILGIPQLAGVFTQAYQHHYIALTPTQRDGTVTLRLSFDPKDNQALRENINFLVLSEEGLRSVLAGGRPVDYDIAMGSFGLFGANQDRLFANFQVSGRGKYTVVVFNNSNVPARYILSAEGALLATEEVAVSLP